MHSKSIANLKKGNTAPRCSYVRLNDQRCTQPALHDQAFCRFHDLVDHPLPDSRLIPFVEDATSLQLALMQVIKSLQLGRIDRPTAGTILYALQIAASNLKHFSEENGHPFATPAPRKTKKEQEEEEELARPSLAEILVERLGLVAPEEYKKRNPATARTSAPSAADQPPDQQITRSPDSPPRPSVVKDVRPPEGGVIDKLEACAEDLFADRHFPHAAIVIRQSTISNGVA